MACGPSRPQTAKAPLHRPVFRRRRLHGIAGFAIAADTFTALSVSGTLRLLIVLFLTF